VLGIVSVFFWFVLVSKLMEILRKRVVSPIDTSPLMIFFCFLLLFHWMVSSGDRMMATPAFASLEGWLGGGR
jgi:hypothetical protein